jgi:hypothetical protein
VMSSLVVTPHIVNNLIYMRQFTIENFFLVKFDSWGFSVKDLRTGAMILRCSSTGDLYPLTSPPRALTVSARTPPYDIGVSVTPVMEHFNASRHLLFFRSIKFPQTLVFVMLVN